MNKNLLVILLALCFSVNSIHLSQDEVISNLTKFNNTKLKKYSNLSEASQHLYDILAADKAVRIAVLLLD
jgi:hypothetical protein